VLVVQVRVPRPSHGRVSAGLCDRAVLLRRRPPTSR
jgi:hypothetical protein